MVLSFEVSFLLYRKSLEIFFIDVVFILVFDCIDGLFGIVLFNI